MKHFALLRGPWILLLMVVAGLLGWPGVASARGPLVLAASSMQEALGDAAREWTASGHQAPVLSYAASSALARQIEEGAPADIFVSADAEWMDYLADRKLVAGRSRSVVASNRLVLVAPKASRLALRIGPGFPLARALGKGRLAIASPDSVPAGRYAKQALTGLAVWPSVSTRLARTENVRAALALVARGETPLGIVYATDALAEPKVRVVGIFPGSSHRRIVYPVARLARSTSREAEQFRLFLLSAKGQAIFRRHGFGGG